MGLGVKTSPTDRPHHNRCLSQTKRFPAPSADTTACPGPVLPPLLTRRLLPLVKAEREDVAMAPGRQGVPPHGRRG